MSVIQGLADSKQKSLKYLNLSHNNLADVDENKIGNFEIILFAQVPLTFNISIIHVSTMNEVYIVL